MTGYTFPQLIDFTRTSAATFVNSSGNIASTPQSRNLLTFTQEFANAAWTKTNSQIVPNGNPSTLSGELRGSGTIGLVGTATAATYNTSTGAGSVTRVDGSNQSYVEFAASASSTYLFTIENTSGADIFVRPTGFGTSIMTIGAGQTLSRYLSGNANYYITSSSGTLTFNVVSVRQVTGALQAPDGTFTADTLVEDTTNAAHTVSSGNATVALGAVTWSVYAKAGTRSWMWLNAFAGGNNRTWFNLANGTVGTTGAGATASITSVGNGWYRCSVTLTSGTTTVSMGINAASADNTTSYAGTSGAGAIFIWGAQLEQASSATDYTRNFGGLFPPRFDYDPVTRAPRGLLIEEQRTNLLTYSEQFDNAAWTKSNATVTADAATSPDGTADADRLVATTTSAQLYQTVTLADSTTYAASVYLKKGSGSDWAYIRFRNKANNNFYLWANLATGVVGSTSGSPTSFSFSAAGNGWYRLSVVASSATGATTPYVYVSSATGDTAGSPAASDELLVYGAQLEAGAFATSYIPTVASQVTRSADVAAINAPNFASWYRSDEGTLLVEASRVVTSIDAVSAALSADGTANNTIEMFAKDSNSRVFAAVAGATQVNLIDSSKITSGVPYKAATAYKLNDYALATGGGTVLTDTSATVPSVVSLGIGSRNGNLPFNGHIRSIRYYPVRLSNAQLQALTV